MPPIGLEVPRYITPEDSPTGSQEVCIEIERARPNILQRPVAVTLSSSDGPAGVGGARSKFGAHVV